MSKKISPVVSEAGILLSLMTELDKRVRIRGGTFVDWHRLVKSEGEETLEQIADLIVRDNLGDIYPVSIQKASLKVLIAAGHYDSISKDITAERFPLDPSQFGNFKLVLVHLNRYATTPEVLAYIRKKNLIPAKIGHQLGFGAKYPEIQREFSIIALGSPWLFPDGIVGTPFLSSSPFYRHLRLALGDGPWEDSCRFLALSK